MKNLMKKFRAGKLIKVMLLSVALTGAMSVFNAQAQTYANKCRFDGRGCVIDTMGCVCDVTPVVV